MRLLPLGVGLAAARSAFGALRRRPPGGAGPWTRTNHAGRDVTLLEGPSMVAGLVCGVLADTGSSRRTRAVWSAALAAIGAIGAYDDLHGATSTKGLKGHLRALAHGEVTSGSMKIVVISSAGLVGAATLRRDAGRPVVHAGTLVDGALVAGAANVANLLDLRPGRALKAALAGAVLPLATGPGSGLSAPVVGSALAVADADLAGTAMLGDCGSNALGAAVGAAVVAAAGGRTRTATLVALTALTLASERVSFSQVIASTPWLRRIDEWGRIAPA